MNEMLKSIEPKSDQLNADDLTGGRTKTIKVTKVTLNSGDAQSCTINYEGDAGKPYKPGKSMRRILVNAWGADVTTYAGRSMTLYTDDSVRFGADTVGGIRISHLSHINEPVTFALTVTRGKKKPFTVKPLATVSAPTPGLIDAGNAAAAGGRDVYAAWLSNLSADNKASIKHLHKGWSDIAKAVVVTHKGMDKQGDIPETNEEEISI